MIGFDNYELVFVTACQLNSTWDKPYCIAVIIINLLINQWLFCVLTVDMFCPDLIITLAFFVQNFKMMWLLLACQLRCTRIKYHAKLTFSDLAMQDHDQMERSSTDCKIEKKKSLCPNLHGSLFQDEGQPWWASLLLCGSIWAEVQPDQCCRAKRSMSR